MLQPGCGDQVGLLTLRDEVGTYLAPGKAWPVLCMLELLYNLQSEPVEADYARALVISGVKTKRRALIILLPTYNAVDAAQPIIAYMGQFWPVIIFLC